MSVAVFVFVDVVGFDPVLQDGGFFDLVGSKPKERDEDDGDASTNGCDGQRDERLPVGGLPDHVEDDVAVVGEEGVVGRLDLEVPRRVNSEYLRFDGSNNFFPLLWDILHRRDGNDGHFAAIDGAIAITVDGNCGGGKGSEGRRCRSADE